MFDIKKLEFSSKFYWGAVLVVFSLMLGKITQAVFILYFDDLFLRWGSVAVYVLSWPLLVLGVWWVGKEYAASLKKYFSYRFYHKQMKERTKKVYGATKARTKVIGERVKQRLIRSKTNSKVS